jgi:hypothetical protein
MRIISWRWTLAILQIMVATAALVYAPYQYKARPHPIGDDFMLLGYRMAWPPPILRTSYALNFPALTVVIPFRFSSWSRRHVFRYQGPPFVLLSVEDCIFLTAVGALWYWLGSKIDRRKRVTTEAPGSKSLKTVSLMIGFLFSAGVTALASFYVMLTDADRPFRQIGLFGLLWGVALLWYFVSNLMRVLRTALGESET